MHLVSHRQCVGTQTGRRVVNNNHILKYRNEMIHPISEHESNCGSLELLAQGGVREKGNMF